MKRPLHLAIFGNPELRDAAGRPLPFRTKKQLGLLVYLALEAKQRGAPRDVLIELLWSDAQPERARHSLSQGLSTIRDKLGNDAVTRGAGPVHLLCELPTDLDLVVAGEPLQIDLEHPLRELENCAGPAFAHWVDSARVRCFKAARHALSEQLQAARSEGDVKLVHERAAQLYTVDPLSDAAVHALAERLLLEHDLVGAIRLLQGHVKRAKKELGCNPHPDVERLLRRLENGTLQLKRPRAISIEPGANPRPEVFVGREAELGRLEALWEQTRSGALKTCLLTGPAGIGKTSLIRRFATSVAARAWPVWQVSCQDIGINIPFAAASELILALARDPGASATDPRWLAEASRVTPGLRTIYPGVPEPTPAPAEAIRLRVAEALARMHEAVSDGGPTLFVFDDIQQMDPASRDVLRVFLRRIEPGPAMVVAAARTSEVRSIGISGEAALHDFDWQATADIPPLDVDNALALVDTLLGDEPEGDLMPRTTITQLAEGNPYLVEMLVSDWLSDPADSLVAAEARGEPTAAKWRPPDTMRQAFDKQYRGLFGNAERIVNLLAVAERRISVPEVASLLAITPQHVDRAVLELIKRGIVRAEMESLVFKNEMHRAFVYYAMSEESRVYLHGLLARVAAQRGAPDDFQSALEESHHCLKAGMIHRAIEAVTIGAELAVTHGAPGEAERALKRVLGVEPEEDINRMHLLLAQALAAQGKYQEALNALANWDSSGESRSEHAVAALVEAESLLRGRLGHSLQLHNATTRARELARTSASQATQMHVLQISAEAAAESGDFEELAQIADAARRIKESATRADIKSLAALTAGYSTLVAGDPVLAIENFTEFVAGSEPGSLERERRQAHTGLGWAHWAAGRSVTAIECFKSAAAIAEQINDLHGIVSSWSNIGVVCGDVGAFTSSANAYRRALRFTRLEPGPRCISELYLNIAGLEINLGHLASSADHLNAAARYAQVSAYPRLLAAIWAVRADLHLASAEFDSAWQALEEAEHMWTGGDFIANVARYDRLRAHCCLDRHGFTEMVRLRNEQLSAPKSKNVTYRIQFALFEEWAAAREGRELGRPATALRSALDLGLVGVLGYSVAIGFAPQAVHPRMGNESGAECVKRLFPDFIKEGIPAPIAVTPPLAERVPGSVDWKDEAR
jgi:DNA-binding SARP family transcriptional activator/predicted DNA-binding transcriptional regulator